jgi:acyl-CoA synthetase (AMP-forming)/AMP-acid ligase II/acyl carrier protein
MPLFHIHGLIAATLTSILSGASLVCSPGFLAPNFFKWMQVFQPSWYTGVPTMHQAILAQAEENQDVLSNIQLRFVRSASSSLPPLIMVELEKTFNTPVIEAYGMTEVSHQIACNPLPPLPRKPGSVGPAAGPEVAIMEESGDRLLASNTIGEIVIRGKNVTMGYAKNPEANKKAFTKGWFRTGDQGYMDEDGYIYITGRLKEIINRGGEKISPREIDEILLSHPAVKQALAFSLPDKKLGEDIAAAVVLKEKTVNERDLREYTSQHLAHFKVPRRIIILEEIPKGPTGKLQRIGLAEKLGLDKPEIHPEQRDFIPPRTAVEEVLAELWCDILGLTEVSVNHEFLNLGGDSMLATQLLSRIQGWLEIEISLLDFFDAPTIAEQAGIAEKMLLEIIESPEED